MLFNYSESYGSIGDRFRAIGFIFFEVCLNKVKTPLKGKKQIRLSAKRDVRLFFTKTYSTHNFSFEK